MHLQTHVRLGKIDLEMAPAANSAGSPSVVNTSQGQGQEAGNSPAALD